MSWLKRIALAVAIAQVVLAAFTREATTEFWLATALGWAAALQLARPEVQAQRNTGWRIAGAALVLIGLLEFFPLHYRSSHRFAPLCAGLGLALTGGPSFLRAQFRALGTLLWPLFLPPPTVLREKLLDLTVPTTVGAMVALRAAGVTVVREGTHLFLHSSELIVLPGCSGLSQIFALVALAMLATVLFSTSARQKAWMFGSAILLGFVCNAVRVAVLSVYADAGQMQLFDSLHEGPTGQICTVAAAGVALLLWWPMLKKAAGEEPPTGPLPRAQNS